jgi:hypothetical protein
MKSKTTLTSASKSPKPSPSWRDSIRKPLSLSTDKSKPKTSAPKSKASQGSKDLSPKAVPSAVVEQRAAGSDPSLRGPRRLTEAGALELAIALGQWFYYEKDEPIFTDQEYDQLEKRYKAYMKKSGSPGGIMPGILDKPGSGETLKDLLLLWRD